MTAADAEEGADQSLTLDHAYPFGKRGETYSNKRKVLLRCPFIPTSRVRKTSAGSIHHRHGEHEVIRPQRQERGLIRIPLVDKASWRAELSSRMDVSNCTHVSDINPPCLRLVSDFLDPSDLSDLSFLLLVSRPT